jgi:hypothetical protein
MLTTNARTFSFLALLCALTGCSSEEPVKQAAAPPDKIQGKAQVDMTETSATDAALNAGGPSVYILSGLNRYRLFLKSAFQVEAGKEYVVEGVLAQKAIDGIGDPDQGKNGYPLESSTDRVVRMAWPGLSIDLADSYSKSLAAKVKRYPARPVILVTKIEPAGGGDAAKQEAKPDKKDAPTVAVPADKQKALLTEGPSVLTAPLWDPAGATAKCKVVIDEEGKISELNSGSQLCESVPWTQFRYKPTMKGNQPAKVNTEVEVRFDPRK